METLLWQWKKSYESMFDRIRESSADEPFNVNGDHVLGDLWAWEKFAEDNYHDQPSQYASLTCLAVALLLVTGLPA
jgi:hypothetical protein